MRRILPRAAAALAALCVGWCARAHAATVAEPIAAGEGTAVERIDKAHAEQANTFGEFFQRVDRLFGETYVEDRDRKTQVRAGGETTINDDGRSTSTALTFALRVPLPALERRFNIFLEVGEDINELGAASDPDFVAARKRFALSAALLARRRKEVEAGLKLNVFWDDGSFASIYPFVRFERLRPPLRYFLEQRVVWDSENAWRSRTDVDVDRALGAGMFARLRNRVDYVLGDPGMQAAHGLILRQLAFAKNGFSYELWLEYNSAGDDPTTLDDDTLAYAQVRWRGRIWRSWVEYELRPAYTWVLGSDRKAFFTFFVSLTVLWDSFIGGSGGHVMDTRP